MAPLSRAEEVSNARTPLGILAHISIEDALNRYKGAPTRAARRAYLSGIYAGVLADRAISGLAVDQHWDHIQVDDPVCVFRGSCAGGPEGFDWSYLDDAFAAADAAHKSVQLIIIPGVVSPTWLMDRIPSCDGLFSPSGTALWDCGKVTFDNFPAQSHADAPDPPLSLPWNPLYILAWDDFLVHLSARYSGHPAFTSIAMAGPTCASTEIIFPTTRSKSVQVGRGRRRCMASPARALVPLRARLSGQRPGLHRRVEADHRRLRAPLLRHHARHHPRRRRRFAGAARPRPGSPWQFPRRGRLRHQQLPRFVRSQDRHPFVLRSGSGPERKVVAGRWHGREQRHDDRQHRRFGGEAAYVARAARAGRRGLRLAVSFPGLLQQQGCPDYSQKNPTPADCVDLTPEQGAANTSKVFFNGTPAAALFGGAPSSASMRYVAVDYSDIQYAQDPKHKCQTFLPDKAQGAPSLQDLYNLAAYELDVMAGKAATLPPSTCVR